ncbi:hypothetical protein LXE06_06250 [Yersinia enterocolitica]|uniref:hypothetical protein n=1 Tax=Yersinia enterocolitica TaxID=630 RepID=UPI001E329434|nr:hypothetical protein [Yersinia enterocolitica]MCE3086617.1 hypothetical protein [Yersinia enterocolitica]UNA06035.1 hypothetical protein vBYenM3014_040 [Yersinia phage vB_YenM_30.14]
MKELDGFTVEQLNDFIKSDHAQCGDVAALARIALAAKRAEPCGYAHKNAIKFDLHDTCRLHEQAGDENFIALYTTPQLNSPEIPEGWKLVPIEPTRQMMSQGHFAMGGTDRGKFMRIYQAMLAAAPEKENG